MSKFTDEIQEERERIEKLMKKYPLLQRADYIKMYYELMLNKNNSKEQTQEYYYKLKALL